MLVALERAVPRGADRASWGQPGRSDSAAYVLARSLTEIVSRRTPVFLSISRKDHPSWPKARTCSLFVSLKTSLIRGGAALPPRTGQRLSAQLAAFAEIMTGRIWVITEDGKAESEPLSISAERTVRPALPWLDLRKTQPHTLQRQPDRQQRGSDFRRPDPSRRSSGRRVVPGRLPARV